MYLLVGPQVNCNSPKYRVAHAYLKSELKLILFKKYFANVRLIRDIVGK